MAANRTTGLAPFKVAMGRLPTTPIAMLHSTGRRPLPNKGAGTYINELEKQLEMVWQEVREAQEEAFTESMKHEPTIDAELLHPGDEVLIDGAVVSGQEGPQKMHDVMDGPYVVDRMVAPGAYRIRGLPKGTPEVWHQSKLKLYKRESKSMRMLRQAPAASRLKVHGDGGVSREVEAIIGVRPGRTRNSREFLVQWLNVPSASWEKEKNVSHCWQLVQDFLDTQANRSGLTSEVARGQKA